MRQVSTLLHQDLCGGEMYQVHAICSKALFYEIFRYIFNASYERQLKDFWNRIPTKLLIALTLTTFLFAGALIWYAVVHRNTPVEIFGIVKFGESADDLRLRLLKAQAEAESRILPEVHNVALAKVKALESKVHAPKIEAVKLEAQLRERDEKITDLTQQLVETKSALESAKGDLNTSRKDTQELIIQVNKLKKDIEQISFTNKRKTILGFVHQLNELEKSLSGSKDPYEAQAHARSYNEVLTALKKELANDIYLQSANPVSILGTRESIAGNAKDSLFRLRVYLEQRYLK